MRWMILYRDGTSFSNLDGEPQDAPGGGVLIIAQEDPVVGLRFHSGEHYYVFGEQWKGWYGVNNAGLWQYLMEPGFKIVKLGVAIADEDFQKAKRAFERDPNLPRKSAHYPWERA